MTKIDLKARHKARQGLVQALYQWQVSHDSVTSILQQHLEHSTNKRFDRQYFTELWSDIPTKIDELDALYEGHSQIACNDIDHIERAVLRLSCYELKYRLDIPCNVSIDQALELTKLFGSSEGFKFINGVLDKVARDLRPHEITKK